MSFLLIISLLRLCIPIYLNQVFFLLVLFLPFLEIQFGNAPDYATYSFWFSNEPELISRSSPSFNALIHIFNNLGLSYDSWRVFILLIFIFLISRTSIYYSKKYQSFFSYKHINSSLVFIAAPLVTMQSSVIRQGLSFAGFYYFLNFYFYAREKNLNLKEFLFSLSLKNIYERFLLILSIFFIGSHMSAILLVFLLIGSEKIYEIIIKLKDLKISLINVYSLLIVFLFFIPTFFILILPRLETRLFSETDTSSSLLIVSSFISFLILFFDKYIKPDLKIFITSTLLSAIFVFLFSPKAAVRLAINVNSIFILLPTYYSYLKCSKFTTVLMSMITISLAFVSLYRGYINWIIV